jgi:putative CRISPR-associated protein (TIGR02619 family)
MQTILMTVGTSLLTNRDSNLDEKRPWVGKQTIGDQETAIAWMTQKTNASLNWMEQFSAETNTFWRLDPKPTDELILLHSDTDEGLECAQVLRAFFQQTWEQQTVQLHPLPGVNYESEQSKSALEKMASLLMQLIEQANGTLTLAATGGFKAQTMIMGIIGQAQGIPVCYVHEKYRTLISLPYLQLEQVHPKPVKSSSPLPTSSRKRSDVIQVQESKQHHRPKTWKKVEKMLQNLPWVECIRYDEKAFAAPQNGVRRSRTLNRDQCYVFWMHLYESEDTKMAISIETTGHTEAHEEQAFTELRAKLSDLLS